MSERLSKPIVEANTPEIQVAHGIPLVSILKEEDKLHCPDSIRNARISLYKTQSDSEDQITIAFPPQTGEELYTNLLHLSHPDHNPGIVDVYDDIAVIYHKIRPDLIQTHKDSLGGSWVRYATSFESLFKTFRDSTSFQAQQDSLQKMQANKAVLDVLQECEKIPYKKYEDQVVNVQSMIQGKSPTDYSYLMRFFHLGKKDILPFIHPDKQHKFVSGADCDFDDEVKAAILLLAERRAAGGIYNFAVKFHDPEDDAFVIKSTQGEDFFSIQIQDLDAAPQGVETKGFNWNISVDESGTLRYHEKSSKDFHDKIEETKENLKRPRVGIQPIVTFKLSEDGSYKIVMDEVGDGFPPNIQDRTEYPNQKFESVDFSRIVGIIMMGVAHVNRLKSHEAGWGQVWKKSEITMSDVTGVPSLYNKLQRNGPLQGSFLAVEAADRFPELYKQTVENCLSIFSK